jgi:type VI secretion system protein ImpB
MADNSQKFLGRNRPPRVQIEYDLELYGAEKMVQIPFVMGVMADLGGNVSDTPPVPIDERKFLEIDTDNFNARLKAMKPHVKFKVPNMLTDEGNLSVDLTFESMDDFSPAVIARKVKGVRELLEARTQLDNLLTHMDGKSGAEELVAKLISDENLMQALTSTPKTGAEGENVAPSNDNTSEKET